MKKQWLALISTGLLLAACATNPVTGKREFNIVSEQQEQQMGDKAHQDVIREFGVYDEKPELNKLVNDIGQKLARISDRPGLPWRFTLLDTPMVNAMALPGGYVYVTRGILERMNSEDELAGVIAHEVSHVAARHTAQRISQSQLAQITLMVGSILVGPAATQAYGGLAQLGTELLFTRYSRGQETQADLLGTAYMTEGGFNPRGSEQMLLALDRLDGSKLSELERYFVDHPDPGKRVKEVRQQIAKMQTVSPGIATAALDRAAFVPRLDSLMTGRSTMETTIRGNTVFQRRYGIILTAPEGWEVSAGSGVLFSMHPRSPARGRPSGMVLIADDIPLESLQRMGNPQNAVRARLEQMGLRYLGSRPALPTRSGEQFTTDVWAGQTSNGQVAVETTQLFDNNNAVVFMLVAPSLQREQSPLGSLLRGVVFDRERARNTEPARMRVATSRSGQDWRDLAVRATGRSEDAEELAEINGFDPGAPVPSGIPLKLPQEVVEEKD